MSSPVSSSRSASPAAEPAVRQAAMFQAPPVAAPAAISPPPQAPQANPPEAAAPLSPEQEQALEEISRQQFEQMQAIQRAKKKNSKKIDKLDTQCTGNLALAQKRLEQVQTAAIVMALAALFFTSPLIAFALGLVAYTAFSCCADRFYQPEKWKDVVQGFRTERFKRFLQQRMLDNQEVSLKNIFQLAQECKNEEPEISLWTDEFEIRSGFQQTPAEEF